jgi:hypothetical protein
MPPLTLATRLQAQHEGDCRDGDQFSDRFFAYRRRYPIQSLTKANAGARRTATLGNAAGEVRSLIKGGLSMFTEELEIV